MKNKIKKQGKPMSFSKLVKNLIQRKKIMEFNIQLNKCLKMKLEKKT
jgi:hypothetical protein